MFVIQTFTIVHSNKSVGICISPKNLSNVYIYSCILLRKARFHKGLELNKSQLSFTLGARLMLGENDNNIALWLEGFVTSFITLLEII